MATVSIIIPIYKAEKYIQQCITCLTNQTYPHSFIECLLIDDCSPDNSISLAKQSIHIYKGDMRFQIINHEINKGVSTARNTGIINANNEYIYFMDVDDLITSDCIEKLVEATQIYPHAQMIVGNIKNQKSNQYHHNTQEDIYCNNRKQILHDTLMFIYTGFPINRLVQRDFINDNKLFFPIDMPFFEDLYWNIDVAKKLDAIAYIPNITYSYEYIQTSAMSTLETRMEELIKCQIKLIEKGFSFIKKDNCYVEAHLFVAHYIIDILNRSNSGKPELTLCVKKYRKELLLSAIKHFRPLLLIYDIQLFNPFRKISSIRFIRNRYVPIRLLVCKISNKYLI